MLMYQIDLKQSKISYFLFYYIFTMKKILLTLIIFSTVFLFGCNKEPVQEEIAVPQEEWFLPVAESTIPILVQEAGVAEDVEKIENIPYDVIISDNAGAETPKYLSITAQFTQEFMDKYKYEDSEWYNFAISIDGNYYNVFRNNNDGVSNSRKHWLDWAIQAYKFKWWYTWKIPLGEQINIAQPKGTYWFKYLTLLADDTKNYVIKISTVKEWVQTHNIIAEYFY